MMDEYNGDMFKIDRLKKSSLMMVWNHGEKVRLQDIDVATENHQLEGTEPFGEYA